MELELLGSWLISPCTDVIMSQVINIGDYDVIVVGDLMCDVIFLKSNIMIMMFTLMGQKARNREGNEKFKI